MRFLGVSEGGELGSTMKEHALEKGLTIAERVAAWDRVSSTSWARTFRSGVAEVNPKATSPASIADDALCRVHDDDEDAARGTRPRSGNLIVQAPAGSGKTEFAGPPLHRASAQVDEPEASWPLRSRARPHRNASPRDRHPCRQGLGDSLGIQTIDSLAASITSRMPWLARFGAPPQITREGAAASIARRP